MHITEALRGLTARLTGKRWAYDTTEEVTELLDAQTAHVHDTRLPVHLAGAAALAELLAFQSGLVDLRAEVYEGALYLEALLTAARTAGHQDLAECLSDAAETLHEATSLLAAATHATVPAPEIPVANAA